MVDAVGKLGEWGLMLHEAPSVPFVAFIMMNIVACRCF